MSTRLPSTENGAAAASGSTRPCSARTATAPIAAASARADQRSACCIARPAAAAGADGEDGTSASSSLVDSSVISPMGILLRVGTREQACRPAHLQGRVVCFALEVVALEQQLFVAPARQQHVDLGCSALAGGGLRRIAQRI